MSSRRFFAERDLFAEEQQISTKELCDESKRSNQRCPQSWNTKDATVGFAAHVRHVWRNNLSSNSRE